MNNEGNHIEYDLCARIFAFIVIQSRLDDPIEIEPNAHIHVEKRSERMAC
jgi:hypothetical protein